MGRRVCAALPRLETAHRSGTTGRTCFGGAPNVLKGPCHHGRLPFRSQLRRLSVLFVVSGHPAGPRAVLGRHCLALPEHAVPGRACGRGGGQFGGGVSDWLPPHHSAPRHPPA
eukprot:gnl/Dysnectes_brevis/2162_a2515_847.p5 GENE.gnl/Dysnectes_brevis/2162_a2515_847~~gnl/Dysnectes_brevis/2162_a2515_847.p5  ORF type:complete len:113 (+),score=31.61 gnl/Dysnectes_brevis/2162_a2515_847:631-969(+)